MKNKNLFLIFYFLVKKNNSISHLECNICWLAPRDDRNIQSADMPDISGLKQIYRGLWFSDLDCCIVSDERIRYLLSYFFDVTFIFFVASIGGVHK